MPGSSLQRAARRRAEFTAQATPESVRDVLQEARGAILGWGATEDAAGTVELVLAEILNNIVEHAYGDGRTGTIHLFLECSPTVLAVQVTDRGRGMEGGRLPNPGIPDLEVDLTDLPEGGFGWAMIRKLTRGLTYLRHGNANHLHFRVPLADEPEDTAVEPSEGALATQRSAG